MILNIQENSPNVDIDGTYDIKFYRVNKIRLSKKSSSRKDQRDDRMADDGYSKTTKLKLKSKDGQNFMENHEKAGDGTYDILFDEAKGIF